jgi:ATP-dependent Lon protease
MGNKEELIIFERVDKDTLRAIDEATYAKLHKKEGKSLRNVILPLERKMFVQATRASEAELLGDVRHDPYGSHPQIGSLPYTRVVAGAVHEAHEGVLFIDELLSLGHLQRNLLTAMQDRQFPITGRNASSTGAAVRADAVPCDFILVASCNINDLSQLLPPLRNRIAGNGYELLVNTAMPDTPENRMAIAQFVAQEIRRD